MSAPEISVALVNVHSADVLPLVDEADPNAVALVVGSNGTKVLIQMNEFELPLIEQAIRRHRMSTRRTAIGGVR